MPFHATPPCKPVSVSSRWMVAAAPDRSPGLLGRSKEEEGSVLARPPGSDMVLVVSPFHHGRDWPAQGFSPLALLTS